MDDMAVEVIADGKHLPSTILRLVYKLKGVEPLSAERLANAKAIFMKHGVTV